MEFLEYPDADLMMLDLADTISAELRNRLAHEDWASLAVPGGTTPGPIFDSLCASHLDWDRVHVFLTDERWVAEDHPRSNTRLLRERLLTDRAAAARLVPMVSDADTPEDGLEGLVEGLRPSLPISVLLLGMGADMHTASIFPGADRLEEALHGQGILVPMRAPGAPEPRLTLSMAVLKDAMSRHIVITGAEKREALERARHLPPEEAPIAALLRGSTIHWAES